MGERGETIIAVVFLGGLGLLAAVFALGMAGGVKEMTEDLVYQEAVGPLHVIKVWEGEFSFGLGKLRKYHWRLEDLDEKRVSEGYADTLEEAVADARGKVSG